MSSMYEAMKKAAEKNPEFQAELDAASKRITRKNQELERIRRENELKKAQYTARQEAERKARLEKERREKEKKNMSELLPFAFSYSPYTKWSRSISIILAESYDAAVKIANECIEEMKTDRRRDGEDVDSWEWNPYVQRIDLSDTICHIFDYVE